MMDKATVSALHALLRREGQSLLQYAHDAYPWTTPEERDVLAELRRIIRQEKEAADAVARLLSRRHLPLPFIGSYPASFTSINFISLSKLLSLLVQSERRSLAELQPELAAINDPEARLLVQRLAELKQRHAHELERLGAAAPPAMVV